METKKENIRMIEELREKADVSYDEARGVLESLDWNMLDALIALEKEGKLRQKQSISYTTERTSGYEYQQEPINESKCDTFGDTVRKVLAWCRKMIGKGCRNSLCVSSDTELKCEIPLIILAVLLIPAWHIMFIIFIIVFFNGMKFSVTGDDPSLDKVNDVLGKMRYVKKK